MPSHLHHVRFFSYHRLAMSVFSSRCRRLFGFATFREYSEAEMAYLTLDMTEFRGRHLNIQFAKSSIASEDEVRMRLEKTQFTAEVTSSRRKYHMYSSPFRTLLNLEKVGRNSTESTDLLLWSRIVDCGFSSREKLLHALCSFIAVIKKFLEYTE